MLFIALSHCLLKDRIWVKYFDVIFPIHTFEAKTALVYCYHNYRSSWKKDFPLISITGNECFSVFSDWTPVLWCWCVKAYWGPKILCFLGCNLGYFLLFWCFTWKAHYWHISRFIAIFVQKIKVYSKSKMLCCTNFYAPWDYDVQWTFLMPFSTHDA